MRNAASSTRDTCLNLQDLGQEKFKKLIDNVDTILFDCDGVLWDIDKAIDGSVEVFNSLVEMGKNIFLITNNSTRRRSALGDKARKMGYNVFKNDQVLNSAFLTAEYLNSIFFAKMVYVLGTGGLSEELERVDIEAIGAQPDNTLLNFETNLSNIEINPNVGAVVVGHDINICYTKMIKAVTYLKNKNCIFIGTNVDERIPSPPNSLILPGAGTMLTAIETASKRQAIMIGKPSTYVNKYLIQRHSINPRRTLLVGDSCHIDILLGSKCGYTTLLVLSGETTMEHLNVYQKKIPALVPDYYLKKLGDMMKLLKPYV